MKTLRRFWLMLVRSRTNLFAAILAGLSVLQLAIPSFVGSMTATEFTAIGVGVAMTVALLRSLTTTPLSEKTNKEAK